MMKRQFHHPYIVFVILILLYGCTEVTNNEQLINVSGLGWSGAAKKFLVQGADVNTRNEDGITPLMNAANNGDPVTVQLLLDYGALVNARDDTGQTALYYAAYRGNGRVIQKLLAAGADVNISNFDGYSPLITALIKDHTYVARVLMEAGADVNARTKYGYTPLFRAARGGYTDIVRELVARGAVIDAREGFDKATPLMYAIDNNRIDIVRILITAGADVNAGSRNGRTPLIGAEDKPAIKKMLLEAGAAIHPEMSRNSDDSMYDFIRRMYGKNGVLDEQDQTVEQFERNLKTYAVDQGRELSESQMEYYRAMYHVARQEYDMALPFINRFIKENQGDANSYSDRAWIYSALGRPEQAILDYSRAIELNTSFSLAYSNRGREYAALKQYGESLADFNMAIALDPDLAEAYMGKAWLLSTCPDSKWRDGKQAVTEAKKSVEILDNWQSQSTLAAAYAESGDFDSAEKIQRQVLHDMESRQTQKPILDLSQQRLGAYKAHSPWRDKGIGR